MIIFILGEIRLFSDLDHRLLSYQVRLRIAGDDLAKVVKTYRKLVRDLTNQLQGCGGEKTRRRGQTP